MFILISRCDITRQSRSARLRPQATECLISNEYFSGHKLRDLKGWDVTGSDQLIYTSLHWTVVEPLMNAGSFASVFFCVVKHLLARCIHANLINIRKGQKSVTAAVQTEVERLEVFGFRSDSLKRVNGFGSGLRSLFH